MNKNELHYKLKLNMNYDKEVEEVNDFKNKIKAELATTLGVDINYLY